MKELISSFLKGLEEKTIYITEEYINNEFKIHSENKDSFLLKKYIVGEIGLKDNSNSLYIVCQLNKARTITNILNANVDGNKLELILLDTEKIKTKIIVEKEG